MEGLQHFFLVDQWQKQSGAYFLTHMHGDHIKGLGSTWSRGPLYCSHVTAQLLCVRFPGFSKGLLRPLEIGVSIMVEVWSKQQRQELMEVTPIDAHHCPGSVMFLFRGSFGTRLHTGDFRWDAFLPSPSCPAPFASRPLPETTRTASMCPHDRSDEAALPLTSGLRQLQDALQGRPVDVLFLDNTYCHPKYCFPKRAEALERVCAIMEAHPEHQVLIGFDSLGKEDLLVSIAIRLQTRIAVSPERLAFARVLGLPDVFTLLPSPSIYATAAPSELSEPPGASKPSAQSEQSAASQSSNPSEPCGPSAISKSCQRSEPSTSEPFGPCGPSDDAAGPCEPSQPLEPPEVSKSARPRICAIPRRSVNLDHLRVLNASAPTIGIVPSGWRSLDRPPGKTFHWGVVAGSGSCVPGSRVSDGTAQAPLPGFGHQGWPSAEVTNRKRSSDPGKEGGGSGPCSNEERAKSVPSVTPAADVLTSARKRSEPEEARPQVSNLRRKGAVRVHGAAAAANEREPLKNPLPEPSAPSELLLFRVPYSLHSCFAELDAFVRLVRPSVIRPIAGKDPYGLDTCPNAHFGDLCKRWGQERGSQKPQSVLAEVSANPVTKNGLERATGGFELAEDEEDALVLRGKRSRKRSALPKVRRLIIRRKRLRVGSISPPEAEATAAATTAESGNVGEATGPPVERSGGLRPGGLDAVSSGVKTLQSEQDLLSGVAEERSSGLHFEARLRMSADTGGACTETDVRVQVKQEESGRGVMSRLETFVQFSEPQVSRKGRSLTTDGADGLASVLPDWYMEAHDRWILADPSSESAAAAGGSRRDPKVGKGQTGQHRDFRSFKRTLPRFVAKAGQNHGD